MIKICRDFHIFIRKMNSILLSWDFISTAVISLILVFLLPPYIPLKLVKEVSNIYITILAITFSIFFAALAIIISSSNDEFILFLEKDDGLFTSIIWTYKITLFINFIALLLSVVIFIISAIFLEKDFGYQHKWIITVGTSMFLYSCFSVLSSILDSVKYSSKRIKYLIKKKEKEK